MEGKAWRALLFSQVGDTGPSTTARGSVQPIRPEVGSAECIVPHPYPHPQDCCSLRGTESLFSDLCAPVLFSIGNC